MQQLPDIPARSQMKELTPACYPREPGPQMCSWQIVALANSLLFFWRINHHEDSVVTNPS